MMPAAKHFDPVLGVDVHIVQPPGPVPPVPVPHPFIGMVIDPMDYVPIIGATVMVGGIPRAQAGTAGKNVPPHIPIGGVFVKPPGNECEVFMGSATVEVDGDAFSYLALPVLSCQDVGMPPPPRVKKKSKTKSLVLPTSVVLSIPSGVFVGGPPTISLMSLGMRAGMAAAGKMFKKLKAARKAKKGKKPKAKKKGKAKDNAPCGTDAHPVDVITGACVDQLLDYAAPGAGGFRWQRWYDSSERDRVGPMGRGWRHLWEMQLERTATGFRFTDETGAVVEFAAPSRDRPSAAGGYVLRQVSADTLQVVEPRLRTMTFRFALPAQPALLTELREGAGAVQLGHDREGRPLWARDSGGRLYEMQYDPGGRVAAVLQRASEPPHAVGATLLRFQYDADGCLVAMTDAFGNRARYDYEHGRITCMQDRRGYRFFYSYDEHGRVVHTRGEDGLWEARLEYVPEASLTIIRFADGGEWLKFYNAQGLVTDVVQPDGGLLTRQVDDEGRVVAEVAPDGTACTFTYDAFGAQQGRIDPFGRFLLPQWIDSEDPDWESIDVPQHAAGWDCGRLVDAEHDAAGVLPQWMRERIPAAARADLGIDRRTEPPPPRVTLDAMARPVRVEHADGTQETWQYDAEGNCAEYVDRDGAVQRRAYASWNLLAAEGDGLGRVVRYTHSLRGQVASVVDAGGATTEYRRDTMERIVQVSRQGTVRERYHWNGASRLVRKDGSDGEPLVETTLAPHGLPAKHTLAGGDEHVLEYDAGGCPAAAATASLEVAQVRDERGRLLADLRDGAGVEHAWGNDGVLHTTTLAKFVTEYRYRSRWDFDVVDPAGAVHAVRTHPAGVSVREFASGAVEVSHYGPRGRCVGRHLQRPDGSAWVRRWAYSAEGDLRHGRDSDSGDVSYAYDAARRLVAEQYPGHPERRIRYDAADNILAMPGLGGVALAPGNRIAAANGARFDHDVRNHVCARHDGDASTRYVHDAADMLVRIEGVRGGDVERAWRAEYDPFGRRTWKEEDGQRTVFHWDGDRLAAEVAPDGAVRIYVYAAPDALVPLLFVDYDSSDADPASGRRRYVFADQRGAPVRVEDDHGRVLWRAMIEPFGRAHVDPAASITLNLRFPGHYLDPETGLHYNRFRYYSPELGRYLQSDPIGAAGGLNVYSYTPNPLVQVDVLGLNCGHARGKTKGRAEGPPHSKSARRGESVLDIADGVGMKPGHVSKLQDRAVRKGERIIVRGSNSASLVWHSKPYNGKPCKPKPLEVKAKTAKPKDPHAGLVKKQTPGQKAPDGYEWDKNDVLVDKKSGQAVHGDYDLQHVSTADGKRVKTNDPKFQRELNDDVCPEHKQFQHGANDDYRVPEKSGRPGRNPDPDESYLVVEPDGTAKQIDGTHNLQKYYKQNKMDWPYPKY